MNELALFAGAGGGILGGILLGWRTVCAVEIDPYARAVLAARQNDGCLPPFPIWDDVRTFDGNPWRGIVDVVSGGFPCQDISAAGKGAGIDGERSGLWGEMARIICEARPRFAFVENSPMLTSRGLGRVLSDLAALGYDARWGVLGADDAIWHSGNPCAYHPRQRIWICCELADSNSVRTLQPKRGKQDERERFGDSRETLADAESIQINERERGNLDGAEESGKGGNASVGVGGENVADAIGQRRQECRPAVSPERRKGYTMLGDTGEPIARNGWWDSEPNVGRVADGVASRVDRLRCLGNGQVPICSAMAFKILSGGVEI